MIIKLNNLGYKSHLQLQRNTLRASKLNYLNFRINFIIFLKNLIIGNYI